VATKPHNVASWLVVKIQMVVRVLVMGPRGMIALEMLRNCLMSLR
jgi:hypothetical protein